MDSIEEYTSEYTSDRLEQYAQQCEASRLEKQISQDFLNYAAYAEFEEYSEPEDLRLELDLVRAALAKAGIE